MASDKKRTPILNKPKTKIFSHSLITRRYGLLVGLMGGLVLFMIISFFSHVTPPQVPETLPTTTSFQVERTAKDDTATPSPKRPTRTPTHKPVPTRTTTPTPLGKCPDTDWMPQIDIKLGNDVLVCTKKDRLIVRKQPKQSAREIIAIYPGSIVNVMQGPYCTDGSWWWEVKVPVNTKYANSSYDSYSDFYYLNQVITGYVREGSDNKDKYFICP